MGLYGDTIQCLGTFLKNCSSVRSSVNKLCLLQTSALFSFLVPTRPLGSSIEPWRYPREEERKRERERGKETERPEDSMTEDAQKRMHPPCEIPQRTVGCRRPARKNRAERSHRTFDSQPSTRQFRFQPQRLFHPHGAHTKKRD